ncbi:MAG: YchJ family metal-binding protein [Glaciecola sp.]
MANKQITSDNSLNTTCNCDSGLAYAACCQPFIIGALKPNTPLQLMRSRYTAYARGCYQYILDTYSIDTQPALSVAELASDNEHTTWLHLHVMDSHHNMTQGEVEFAAYYKAYGQLYCMHERSQFVYESSQWSYLHGAMLNSSGKLKHGRNDLCFCNSGKKFKRCCGK